jgi:hypothetical protein
MIGLTSLKASPLTQKADAQDGMVFRDLEINQRLINAKKHNPKKSERPFLKLPFFDDFSALHSPFPNDSLWEDDYVFINASFPLFPPTIGVATFDALDANGRVYEHATPYTFSADTLTSRPIRLDSVFGENPRDLRDIFDHRDTIPEEEALVFLSFYYQPGGGFGSVESGTRRGGRPRRDDVLILEFLNGNNLLPEPVWDEIWRTNGESLATFCPLCVVDSVFINDSTKRKVEEFEKTFFKQVAIPIVYRTYLYSGFQFRFRNLSSIPNNSTDGQPNVGGQWHIDYVRLDIYPDGFDSSSNDIAFVEPSQRVLKDFQAMPAKHFRPSQDLVSEIPLLVRNMSSTAHQADYQYRILDQNRQIIHSYPTPPSSFPRIEPFSSHGFLRFGVPLNYNFPNVNNSKIYSIQHIMKPPGNWDLFADNDTMTQIIHLDNFYAYDDGTPEEGFGFTRQNERATSEFAYRFPLRQKDTLIGVQIWFNHTLENMDRAFFNLAVWNADPANNTNISVWNGDTVHLPSQNLASNEPDLLPVYADTIGFYTYWLSEPIELNSGNFFVGFQQHHNIFLNMGFDQNNNAFHRMFYKVHQGEGWQWQFKYGAAMIRPVFGTRESTRIYDREDYLNNVENIKVFPNPSDGFIFVESLENIVNTCEIYDLGGRKLLQKTVRNTEFSIKLPDKSGFYILLLHTENGLVSKKVVRR